MESADTSLWYKQLSNNNSNIKNQQTVSNIKFTSFNDSILTTSPSSSSSSSFSTNSTSPSMNAKMDFLKQAQQNDKSNHRQQSPHDSSQRQNENELINNSVRSDSPLINPNKLVSSGHQVTLSAANINMLRPYGLNFLNNPTPTLTNNIYQLSGNNEFSQGIHQQNQLQQQQHNQMQSIHGPTLSSHHHQNLIHHQQQQQQQSFQQQQYQLHLHQQQQSQLMNYNRNDKNDDNDEENELMSQANLRNSNCNHIFIYLFINN